MNRKKWLWVVGSAVAAAIVIVLAFWPAKGPGGGGNEPLTQVRLGYLPSLAAAQIYVAVDQDIFRRHGLRVDLTEIYSGPEVVQSLQARSSDVGFGVVPSVLLARSKGVPVRSLVGATTDSPTIREHRLIVPVDSPISSPADLQGRRIALVAEPTSDGVGVFEYLEKHGLKRSDVTLVRTPHPDMLVALSARAVDAAAAIEPFISEGKRLGKTRELDYYYPDWETEVGTFLVMDDWVAAHPETARKFVAAIREATAWINEDPNRLRELLPRLQAKGIRFSVSEQAASEIHLPGFKEAPTRAGVIRNADLLQKHGFLQTPVDPSLVLPPESK